MTSSTSDVVIIGGGIVGCLTAYLLARQGLKVTLLEADAVGSHASGFAFGEMGPLEGAGIPDPLLDFTVWSLERHRTLAGELREASGVDNQYQDCDRLKLAFDEATVASYREDLKWQRQVSECPAQWLEPEEVVNLEPMANPECLGATYVQRAGAVEPYRHTLAAAQAGENAGVAVLLRRATGLLTEKDRCLGVTYDGGQLEAGIVVLAMGPWTGQASTWCRYDIPVTPLKGQILRLQHGGPAIKTSLHWGGSYVASKPDGLIWAGTTEEEAGFDDGPTMEARNKIMGDLLRMAPTLADANLVRQTACLRPLSADGMPIVGQVPGWTNLFVGTGAGRKGILWSTGMSFGLADLVLEGKTGVPGLQFLDPGRFRQD
jgi:glycine oxidase